ncbi:recombinase family protein [Parvibaculum sp.]|uniref:recombinase family protein n=1 Tax=Parvibaculum sp. TaxID=2024848 RepID=UPI003919E07D
MGQKAIVYARVSTTRQADHDLSIPDQIAHAERYCKERDIEIVGTYVDPGASARDDNRPQFQRMMDDVKSGTMRADMVLVHSFSRFFRDAYGFAVYSRMLEKNGIRLVSMTQETGEGAQADLMRQILSSFDEYQSAETAKHVTRSMIENAKRGFWNGAAAPYGYKTIVVERHGNKDKKKLDLEPQEAEIVKMIFQLYLYGDGKTGPLGIKNLVSYLNGRGVKNRNGKPFRIQHIQEALRRSAYIGTYYFNRTDSRTRKPRPREDWIEIAVPPIVEESIFHAVQAQLDARNPTMTPPRIASSRILLTGVATCESCGALMRTRTGKNGQYWYYTCSRSADMGKTGCAGVTVPMGKLDAIVTDALCDRVLRADRLEHMLGSLLARNSGRRAAAQAKLKELKRERRELDQKLAKLTDALEKGVPLDTVRSRIAQRQNEREQVNRAISLVNREIDSPLSVVTPEKLEAFANGFRARLREEGEPGFRKAYLRLLLDNVAVAKDRVRISGRKDVLAYQLTADKPLPPSMVPTFMDKWRARNDSNVRPSDS